VLEDITDRKRMEAELGRLESRVQQAQRMEVLGRLAGESRTTSTICLVRISNSAFVMKARQSWILSDSSQLDQVVANLAINARDAIPGGGRLTISTRNAASPPDHASDSNARSENWVVLGIADSGLGIDEKTRAQIFEPFFTTNPDGKGTGLGLATVYGIVKQSRGHIHVDPQPGNGTRFEPYFPALDGPRRILRHQIHGSGC